MQRADDFSKRNVLLLIPTTSMTAREIKKVILHVGIAARYNTGPIPTSLANTYAPVGRMIFPMSLLDKIFDPFDVGDYSDFDISTCWSNRELKDIERNGPSNHIIAAAFASTADLESLHAALNFKGSFVWHWNQWVSLSQIEKMHWAY